jgi:crotonobetainyl-CoA:carnitine CoA-transferase CaiB-like acyl-CoA transferase
MCSVMGDDGKRLAANELYRTNKLRVANRTTLLDELSRIFITKPVSHWISGRRATYITPRLIAVTVLMNVMCIAFDGVDVPCSAVNSLSQAFSNPQILHDNMVRSVNHPSAGTISVVGPPVKYSDTPAAIRSPPPLLGQHTRSVLANILKLSDDNINDLYRRKVIGCHSSIQS